MRVSDLMTTDVLAMMPDETVEDLDRLMRDRNVRHVPIVDRDGDLLGVVSHRDLLRHALIEQQDVPDDVAKAVLERVRVRDVMIPEPITIEAEADLRAAAQLLWDHKVGCLPVVEGRRLIGILTESDFVRLMAEGD